MAGRSISVGDIHDGRAIAIGQGATAVYQGLSVEEVAMLVVELKQKDQPAIWNGRYPYVGLNAFQESDAEFFFGREELVNDLLYRVQKTNFITIAGPSGSGKSSVARAGLFHALRQGRVERSDSWLLVTMQPKGNPIEQLALGIEQALQQPRQAELLRKEGMTNPDALYELITVLTPAQRPHCVLLVDQFEDIFTQTKEEALQVAFIKLLTTAAQTEDGRMTIVLSLRADFVSHCASHPKLRALMSQEFQLVGAMEPANLARAIALPALQVGAEIEAELVSRIIDDMKGEPGALPLMSFALRDLFDAEKSKPGQPMDLTLQEYLERGGIEEALERHADKVFTSFSAEQQVLAQNIFAKLIEVGQGRVDTRRTATLAELVPGGVDKEEVMAVVGQLAQEGVRLITTSIAGSEAALTQAETAVTTVTIAHEKLIDAWPWLRRLVDENRESIALQNQIQADAQVWTVDKDAGFLYQGGRLVQVEERLEHLAPSLDALSQTFIQASLDQRQREIEEREAQRRTTITILATAFGVAVLLAIVAFLFFLQSNKNLERADMAGTAEADTRQTAEAEVLQRSTAEAKAVENLEQSQANHRRTTAHRLALTAEGLIDENPQLAILLASEAIRVTQRAGEETVAEAHATLVRLLKKFTARPLSQALVGSNYAAFAPDGHSIMFANDRSVSIVELDPFGLTESIVSIPWTLGMIQRTYGPVNDWFMAQSQLEENGKINNYVMDLTSQQATNIETWPISLSSDGRWIVVLEEPNSVHLVDTQMPTGDLSGVKIGEHWGGTDDPVLSEDGRWLAMLDRDYAPQLFDLRKHANGTAGAPQSLSESRGSRLLRFSQNSRWLLAADTNDSTGVSGARINLWRLDRNTWQMASDKTDFFRKAIGLLDVSPRGNWLGIVGWRVGDMGDNDSYVSLWHLGDQDFQRQLPLREEVNYIAFSSDDRWIAAASHYDSTVHVWDLTDYAEAKRDDRELRTFLEFKVSSRGVSSLHFLKSRNSLLVLAGEPQIWHLDARDPPGEPEDFLGRQINSDKFVFAPNKDWMVTLDDDGPPWLWMFEKPNSGAAVHYSEIGERELLGLAAQVAGRNLTPGEWSTFVTEGAADVSPERTFEEFSNLQREE